MSYQCVKCKCSYFDDAKEILEGCLCGSKAFFYVKNSAGSDCPLVVQIEGMDSDSKLAIQESISDIDVDEERLKGHIVRDDSCITVDVDGLLNKKDVIYSPEAGTYTLDLDAVFSGKRPKL